MPVVLLKMPKLCLRCCVLQPMAECDAAGPLQGQLLQGLLLHRGGTLCPAPASCQGRGTAVCRPEGSCSVQGPHRNRAQCRTAALLGSTILQSRHDSQGLSPQQLLRGGQGGASQGGAVQRLQRHSPGQQHPHQESWALMSWRPALQPSTRPWQAALWAP